MGLILKADLSGGSDSYVTLDVSGFATPYYITYSVQVPQTTAGALAAANFDRTAWWHAFKDTAGLDSDAFWAEDESAGANVWDLTNDGNGPYSGFTVNVYHTVQIGWDGTTVTVKLDGTTVDSFAPGHTKDILWLGGYNAPNYSINPQTYYFQSCVVGSTPGGSELFTDGFAGGDLSAWTSTVGSVSVVTGDPPAPPGRVLVAFDDVPLEPNPVWTVLDQGGAFPDGFVSGYDTAQGRQTLLTQTDTGTATVYINDYDSALFDPRNVSSAYFGKLDGKQILLQLYDPVAAAWEEQFRGWIDDITWDIDGSAVDADGKPINASIQIDCVDMFDYLAGYGLTPGINGVTPPAGGEDGVWYATTAGTVDDRMIEILTDVGIDSSRYHAATGNVHVLEVKYDPDESALQALRDAADAELPFIANIYCDRHGIFRFRGRYSRFAPDSVSAETTSDWDFHRWPVGDGAAITADSTRAQIRVLSFGRNRSDIVNAAICYPQGLAATDMPGQVYADTTSITDYGKHAAAPMSDLLVAGPVTSGFADAKTECLKYAELLVKNQKDPRETITALEVKAIRPDGSPRATTTWALLTKADISDIVNVDVGYPGGTGLAGASPEDDYYIEGRQLRVRPLNTDHDYVELDLDLSPAVWSMDTHNVFPAFS